MANQSLLRSGISGFHQRIPAPSSYVQKTLIEKVVKSVSSHDFVPVSMEWAEYPRNFHVAEFRLPTHKLFLIFNELHPVVAFCECAPEPLGEITFLEPTLISFDTTKLAPFFLPSKSQLEVFPAPPALLSLNSVELAQVKYWKPKRVGDIIFNDWG